MPKLSDAVEERIRRSFTYHSPRGDQPVRYGEIRDRARAFATLLATSCPESRELSTALARLEECVMWSCAAIARNE